MPYFLWGGGIWGVITLRFPWLQQFALVFTTDLTPRRMDTQNDKPCKGISFVDYGYLWYIHSLNFKGVVTNQKPTRQNDRNNVDPKSMYQGASTTPWFWCIAIGWIGSLHEKHLRGTAQVQDFSCFFSMVWKWCEQSKKMSLLRTP